MKANSAIATKPALADVRKASPALADMNVTAAAEIAFELCRTLIEGRTYTAEGVAEAFRKIYDTVKSCK